MFKLVPVFIQAIIITEKVNQTAYPSSMLSHIIAQHWLDILCCIVILTNVALIYTTITSFCQNFFKGTWKLVLKAQSRSILSMIHRHLSSGLLSWKYFFCVWQMMSEILFKCVRGGGRISRTIVIFYFEPF